MPNTFTLIASSTVGAGGASSITFSSIPSTYTDLVLMHSLRSDNAQDYLGIQFNGSTSSFTSKQLQGDGTNASSASRSDNLFTGTVVQSTYDANIFSNGTIYIPNYAGSTNKSFSYDVVQERNATYSLSSLMAGQWSNTSAISSITLAKASGNFVQYNTAYLYGVKNS